MKLFKLIIAFAFLPVLGKAQTIKLNLAKGAKYEVTTATKVNSVASVMGQEMESNNDINITETIKVNDARATETDLVSTVTKVAANMQAMGQEMVYDSDKKDNTGPLAETFDKMKGKDKNITVDGNGKIIKQDKDDETLAAGGSMMGMSFDALAFLKNGFIGKELKPGTTWHDSVTTIADKLTNTVAGNYTILAVNGGTVTIGFTGKQISSGTIEQMGMQMATSSTGKVNSEFEVDIASGLVKKSTQTTDANMNIEASGMSIPATVKTVVTTTAKQL